MALKKSTIKQLKALGLHTDWLNDDFALRVIKMELDKIKAEQWKAEEERRAKEAAKTWPQELSIGAELVEVASERHVIITALDFKKSKVTYRLIEKYPDEQLLPQTWDMSDELERYKKGQIRLAKVKQETN